MSGPSAKPEGFLVHRAGFLEGEMSAGVRVAGFRRWYTYRFGRARRTRRVNGLTLLAERFAGWLPRKLQRRVSRRLFQGVLMVVIK